MGRGGRGGPQAASNRLLPSGLAGPAFGQVQSEVAAATAGGAGSDVDQIPADRRAAGPGMEAGGQAPGGADQVAGDGGQCEPGGIGGEPA